MADTDFLALVEQGAESWNRWRADHPEVQPDLSTAYLFGQMLDGFDLSGTNLERACLIGASLRGAKLNGACLRAAYASSSHLNGADLSGANLDQADFSDADFSQAIFLDAQAISTNFANACFTGVCLSRWLIDHTTALDNLRGSHLYLAADRQQRKPRRGAFQPGKLIEAVQQLSSAGSETQPATVASPRASARPIYSQLSKLPFHPIFRRPWLAGLSAAGAIAAIGLSAASLANGLGISLRPDSAVSLSEQTPPPAPEAEAVSSIVLPCDEAEPSGSLVSAISHEYQDGALYYGDFVDGQPADGRGTMVYPSGNRYDGEYQNGQRHGCGTFSFGNGRRYIGQFEADQFSGKGTWILENGERYIGEFKDNQCDGSGTFVLANGSLKSGIWEAGTIKDGSLSCEQGSLLPASPAVSSVASPSR
ncbi:MAG: pentapeptide repeat-containing protein [Phormidesmis sp.]